MLLMKLAFYQSMYNDSKTNVFNVQTSSCMNSSKLTTYYGFKTQYVTESYVYYLLVRKYRNVYAIFRSSAHCLAIERGRYTSNVIESCFCPYCKNIIENELHFLLVCPLYKVIRKQFIDVKYYTYPCLNKFNALMSCGNEEVVKRTAIYLFYAFEKRKTMFNE